MIYDYVVTLRNERGRMVDVISFLIVFLSAFLFITVFFFNTSSYIFLVVPVLLAIGIVWNLGRKRKKLPLAFSKLLIIAGITWVAMPSLHFIGIGITILLLSLLEKPAKLPLEIGFTSDRIVFNNLFRRKLYWEDFNNILLKDGILTLDFKNNRLFQRETIDEEGDAEEEEFNEYCETRLKLANKE